MVQRPAWKAKADSARSKLRTVRAWRGSLLDRNGDPLAVTMVTYRVNVATRQLRDTAAAVRLLARVLDQPATSVAARIATEADVHFRGPFSARQANQLRGVSGIYLDPMRDRAYPRAPRAAPILGGFDRDSAIGRGGLEAAFDTLLRGTDGIKVVTVDGRGMALEGPNAVVRQPVRGSDVYLTIDANLQAIAGTTGARHPREQCRERRYRHPRRAQRELLAVASLRTLPGRTGLTATASAFVEPYEPGSTAKIFTAAAVLREGVDTAPQEAMGGSWEMPTGRGKTRTIEDVHALSGPLTLGETIKHSSNIVISKFAIKLTDRQHYRALRDFGFGTSPGTGFPGEGSGKLVRPALWENRLFSQASLAQGYEFMSTAVQMASAYAALANGGRLIVPTLVREIRGDRVEANRVAQPRWCARSSMPKSRGAPWIPHPRHRQHGHRQPAQLDRLRVIGKTGTAKHVVGKRYTGIYRASFAGIYPGHKPQVVIYVMIDKPKGRSYYGGYVAAPVAKSILQQALAIRSTPLDRSALAATVTPRPRAAPAPVGDGSSHLVTLTAASPPRAAIGRVPLPVDGWPRAARRDLRTAPARMIVKAVGRGRVRSSIPAGGDSLPVGAS